VFSVFLNINSDKEAVNDETFSFYVAQLAILISNCNDSQTGEMNRQIYRAWLVVKLHSFNLEVEGFTDLLKES
jgi:hypothetical protein